MIPGLKKRKFSIHDVFMYVALVRKHVRLIGLLLCVAMLGAVNYYMYARPVYYAKSLSRLDYVPQPLDAQNLFQDALLGTSLGELNSPLVMERTARRFGITESARDIQLRYILKLRAGVVMRRTVEIEVWATSPDLAANWAKAVIEEHEAYRREKHQREREMVFRVYTQAIQDASGKMGESLDQKMNLQDQNSTIKTMIALQKYQSMPAELVRMGKRIDDMGRIKLQLEDPNLDIVAKLSLIASLQSDRLASTSALNVGDQVDISTPGDQANAVEGKQPNVIVVPSLVPADAVWREFDKQLQVLIKEKAEKSVLYLPGHKVMRALQAQIDELQSKMEMEYLGTKKRFDLEYQELINRRQSLESQLDEYSKVNKQGESVRQQNAIFRLSRLNWERIISEMQRKLEALEYAWDRERVDITYLNLRDFKDTPVSPNFYKLLGMALGLGLVLGVGLPFLIEYLDHTIHSLDEVESTCNLRGLGIVPKLEPGTQPALLSDTDGPAHDLIENFRVIRTNLLSVAASSRAAHVMMVTSAMPKEGKTVVSANLAISFSRNGGKTLLLDTDLRRGRMHRLFGYRKSPGLSNVLLDEISLEDACRPTSYENLFVLSAGKHLDAGAELLASQKFADIMGRLRERFDHVVIDTPPVLGLSETSIMQKLVDGVLFVIWSGNTPIRSMRAAIDMLQANGANFYGFVLNRLDLNATQNYYQYYYYSHDYYYNYRPAALEQA